MQRGVPVMSRGEGTTLAPKPKVAAGGAAGAAGILIVFIAGQLGLEVSGEVAAAITTLLSFTAAYFKREA